MASILNIRQKQTNDVKGTSKSNTNETLFSKSQSDIVEFSAIDPRWDLEEIILNKEIKDEIREMQKLYF